MQESHTAQQETIPKGSKTCTGVAKKETKPHSHFRLSAAAADSFREACAWLEPEGVETVPRLGIAAPEPRSHSGASSSARSDWRTVAREEERKEMLLGGGDETWLYRPRQRAVY
ncbi:Os05g0384250 [Oryza sativa Japonica Group]|uniref:Os05g0384250 protein n=1 Tax=Oryza sativa subsp. japonica TaxID=39947 RepID=A0A0N7KKP5_ORYSJ|nr:Os05g0384250 [Oryza sativa Japonica Group]